VGSDQVPSRSSRPFDGAAHWFGSRQPDRAIGEDVIERVPNPLRVETWLVLVLVRSASVGERAVGPDDEDVRCDHGAKRSGDILGFIVEVRAGEFASHYSVRHRLQGVPRGFLDIVGIDLQKLDTHPDIVADDVVETVMPCESVGAVVTGKDHDRRAYPWYELDRFPISVWQGKARYLFTKLER
jgi:hypothetical protein